jgi:hypothetical protein
MAKKDTDKKNEIKYSYPEIAVRFRNVKPNIRKQIGAIAKLEGFDNTNDFLKIELTKIRDTYAKKYPQILNLD